MAELKESRRPTNLRAPRTLRMAGLLIAAVLAAGAVTHVWLDRRYSGELRRHLQILEGEGIPTSPGQPAAEAAPEGQDGAVLLLRALPPLAPGEKHSWEPIIDRLLSRPGEAPDASALAEARRLLDGSLKEALTLLHEAAERPEARYPLMPRAHDVEPGALGSALLAVRLLTAEGLVRHASGLEDEAVDSFRAALRTVAALRAQRDRTCWTAAWPAANLALAGIQSAHAIRPLSPGQMRRMDIALAGLDWMAGSRNLVDAHTAAAAEEARLWQSRRGFRALLLRPYAAGMHLRLLEFLEAARELADAPWRDWPADVRSPRRSSWLAPGRALVEIVRPSVTGAFWQRDAIIACCSAMRLSLALEAHRRETGEYPRHLEELRMPGGTEPPEDPFTGEPFLYARTRSGYLFYSAGPDLKDDQGRVRKKTKQPTEEGDLVWDARSWLPREPE